MSTISDIINNNSIILRDDLSENMCVLESAMLENYTEQWKYNRNLNSDKIHEIKKTIKDKYIRNNSGMLILDTVLHFFYVNNGKNEQLICFDGNHRRESLILLNKIDNINIKVCCYIYKNIKLDCIDKEIIEKFKIINQMTPIPDIYYDILHNLEENTEVETIKVRVDIIENIFTEFKKNFKQLYSVKSKCRRPNFNETSFKDLCNGYDFTTEKQLRDHLIELNNTNKNKNKNKISENILNKCEAYDFYLFI